MERGKIFLGGTCNGSNWRQELIDSCLIPSNIPFFNPVVEDWTPECIEEEDRQKEVCTHHLYFINSEMTGVYSVAEAVESSHLPDKRVMLVVDTRGFSEGQLKSFVAVGKLISKRGHMFCFSDEGIKWVASALSSSRNNTELKGESDE